MDKDDILLYGVGDICCRRDNPESILAPAKPTLDEASILFGQLEVNLSERGAPQMAMYPGFRTHPRSVKALTYGGFDVVSFASNHTLDWGEEAFSDTIEVLQQNGIKVIGVGRNIDEARRPVIIEKNGTRVAFLAYCSVLPKGYEARADKSGCAPMRATTFYEQVDWQPGTPPRIVTLADKADLAAMVEDIKRVRPLADIVVLSLHWGTHYVPAMIAMYQKEVGYAAIDAGVDLILGHHAHILKGIEVYKGKVIFYSLCNFAFDNPITHKGNLRHLYSNAKPDPEYPSYFFPADSRKTVIARCLISNRQIKRVSFLPVMVNKQSQPEVLPASDSRSSEVTEYMEWCCKDQSLNVHFSRRGNEVLISD